jgi:hypothetical protein
MLEAAAVGKPMVVTNVGALQDYFPASEAFYIPPFNPPALRDAVDQLAAAPMDALRQAQAAATGLLARDLTTEHYAMQHVRITQEMLRARAGVRGRGAQSADADKAASKAANNAASRQAQAGAAQESRGGL